VAEPPGGPGRPFERLLDVDTSAGLSLPETLQLLYDGDWRLPPPTSERPYTYANFVTSHDGRISFAEPGQWGGGAISRQNRHDQWLMGLLRARADAILVGETTLQREPTHDWTAEAIFPDDAPAWQELRQREGRAPVPLHIFLSQAGDLPRAAAVFDRAEIPVLIATTVEGAAEAESRVGDRPNVAVEAWGTEWVDLPQLLHALRTKRGLRTLLCEGGAHVYGALLAAQQLDDTFLTLSPIVVGNYPRDAGPVRPSLVEGVAFPPEQPPHLRLLSVRRHGDYLFLRSRLV
jgi:riboflavin biosynthesis pyrimidine reductase